MNSVATEKVFFHCAPHRPEIERINVQILHRQIPTHSHAGFVIGVVLGGVKKLVHRGTAYDVPAGALTLLNPEELHSGGAAGNDGVFYQTLHVPEADMLELAPKGFSFPTPILHNASIARRFADQLAILDATRNSTQWDERLAEILFQFSSLFSSRPAQSYRRDDPRILTICDFIEENLQGALDLDSLSSLIDLSKFHFIRLFRETIGVTPHVYIQARRTARAIQLLKTMPPAQVVDLCGFVDQSHLTRWIKACYATTPSAYHKRFRALCQPPKRQSSRQMIARSAEAR